MSHWGLFQLFLAGFPHTNLRQALPSCFSHLAKWVGQMGGPNSSHPYEVFFFFFLSPVEISSECFYSHDYFLYILSFQQFLPSEIIKKKRVFLKNPSDFSPWFCACVYNRVILTVQDKTTLLHVIGLLEGDRKYDRKL